MDNYAQLYILINVFCAFLLIVFAVHSRIGMGDSTSRRYFAATNYAIVVFLLSDITWFALNNGLIPQIWWLGTLVNNVYFLSVTVAGYLWFVYLALLAKSKALAGVRGQRLAVIPTLIHLFLCIYNVFDPILFGIDENFNYFRGPLFLTQYAFYYLYLGSISIYALIKAFKPENYIDRTRYLVVAMFPVLPAVSGALQMTFTAIPMNAIAFTLNLTIVYMNELGQQVSQEPLTQLANRKQLMRALDQGIESHGNDGQLYLYMMDLDHFKSINDTYGHTEGDFALASTGVALKRAVSGLHQRATVARYAGDEFAIIAYFDSPQEAEDFKQVIKREIQAQNDLMAKDYVLDMSVGYAQYSPDMKGFKAFIEAADAQLYQEKQQHNQQG